MQNGSEVDAHDLCPTGNESPPKDGAAVRLSLAAEAQAPTGWMTATSSARWELSKVSLWQPGFNDPTVIVAVAVDRIDVDERLACVGTGLPAVSGNVQINDRTTCSVDGCAGWSFRIGPTGPGNEGSAAADRHGVPDHAAGLGRHDKSSSLPPLRASTGLGSSCRRQRRTRHDKHKHAGRAERWLRFRATMERELLSCLLKCR
jgi:hypothetical protein